MKVLEMRKAVNDAMTELAYISEGTVMTDLDVSLADRTLPVLEHIKRSMACYQEITDKLCAEFSRCGQEESESTRDLLLSIALALGTDLPEEWR